MSPKPSVCVEIEASLLAAATGEAAPPTVQRVERHVGACAPCRAEFDRYRVIDRLVAELRGLSPAGTGPAVARGHLESRLADLRRRLVMYRVFPSPLGRILIARSEQGISLVEYLTGRTTLRGSRLGRLPEIEAVEDGDEMEALYRELLDYLHGTRTRFDWPLDLRLVRSDFHRTVLQATAQIPYGAVTSYTGLACTVGKPAAVRAVAQALRWNPLPIVIPCHRVVGTSGSLTGYAGNRTDLKHRLLAAEGVPTVSTGRDFRIARGVMYALCSGEQEYCLPTCPSVCSQTLARLMLFGSRERAEATGLRPCTTCRPDLHPISR